MTRSMSPRDPMLPQGTDRCRCSGCGEYFASGYAFGKHRVGPFAPINKPDTRRCLTVEEMTVAGWVRIASGHWITGKRPVLTLRRTQGAAISTDPLPDIGVADSAEAA